MCRLADISDGTSETYLVGEKYLDPDHYYNGLDGGDDQCWDEGYDFDVNRWTCIGEEPAPDQPGVESIRPSAVRHAIGFQMALCDGSVRMINYGIDPETNRRLGNRHDGLPIDAKKW